MFLWGRSWGSEDRWSPPCWCNTAQFPLRGGRESSHAVLRGYVDTEQVLLVQRALWRTCSSLQTVQVAILFSVELPGREGKGGYGGRGCRSFLWGTCHHGDKVAPGKEGEGDAGGPWKSQGLRTSWPAGRGGCAWPQILSICLLRLTLSQAVSAP